MKTPTGDIVVSPTDIAQLSRGRVRRPGDPTLAARLEGLEAAFPVAEGHRVVLQALGAEYVFARELRDRGWLALVRFSLETEAQFGLTREVAVVYTPFRDLQRRTVEGMTQVVNEAARALSGRAITSHVAFLSSPDDQLVAKLADWQGSDALTVIPLPSYSGSTENAQQLLKTIASFLYRTKPFADTLPVTGDNFFGRQTLLSELLDDSRAGRVSGVFGLRKCGKSSVIQEVGRLFEGESDVAAGRTNVYLLCDLEKVPTPPANPVPTILQSLRTGLLATLKNSKLRMHGLAELPDVPDVGPLMAALEKLLKRNTGLRLLLALDEVEYLSPRICDPPYSEPLVGELLGGLRSLVQETGRVAILLSGLSNAVVADGRIHGRPNPFFAFARPHYLASLPRDEMAAAVNGLATRAGLRFAPEACDTLYQLAGGHPYLTRTLAGIAAERAPIALRRPDISGAEVAEASREWRRSMASWSRETFGSLERYYPEEFTVLELFMDDVASLHELEMEYPGEVDRLSKLGLIADIDSDVPRASPLLRLLPKVLQ